MRHLFAGTFKPLKASKVVTNELASQARFELGVLPHYYTHVPPVSIGVKDSPVPAGASVSLQRNDYESHKEEEDRWLRIVHEILLDTEIEAPNNILGCLPCTPLSEERHNC